MINNNVEKTTDGGHQILERYLQIFVGVSIFITNGYLFFNIVSFYITPNLFIQKIGVILLMVSLTYGYGYIINMLTRAVIGKRENIDQSAFTLIYFFILVFINTIFLFVITPGIVQSGKKVNGGMELYFAPFLLYAGAFFHSFCVSGFFAERKEILIGERPVSTGLLILLRLFFLFVSILSFLPVEWFGLAFIRSIYVFLVESSV